MPLVPIEWLGSHVELPAGLTPEGLAAALVRVGLEEETIHAADVAGPVVVGRVLTRQAEEHKNGKVVNYCRVDVGQHNDAPGTGKEPSDLPSRGIVCGAHNFDVGDYVVVSLPGAVLPGGFAISARKTYGHLSDGMICSMRELGLGEDHDGIIVLAAAGLTRLGLADRIRQYLPLDEMLPAPGQGMLGIEIRADRDDVRQALAFLNDPEAARIAAAERAVSRQLGGNCKTPLAAHARFTAPGQMQLDALLADDDGRIARVTRVGKVADPEEARVMGEAVAAELKAQLAAAPTPSGQS